MPEPHFVESFSWISTKDARVLILGTVPSLKSMAAKQYYAHPQNMFWPILGKLFGMPVDSWEQRQAVIRENHLALWDVLKSCERTGSLDTRIDDKTIEVHDFAAFFKKHPHITHVFFNGQKAEKEFHRRVLPTLPEKLRERLVLERVPSTSPAMATMSKAKKLNGWKVIVHALER
jgi:double-stranded uracil-DNA glycosylase